MGILSAFLLLLSLIAIFSGIKDILNGKYDEGIGILIVWGFFAFISASALYKRFSSRKVSIESERPEEIDNITTDEKAHNIHLSKFKTIIYLYFILSSQKSKFKLGNKELQDLLIAFFIELEKNNYIGEYTHVYKHDILKNILQKTIRKLSIPSRRDIENSKIKNAIPELYNLISLYLLSRDINEVDRYYSQIISLIDSLHSESKIKPKKFMILVVFIFAIYINRYSYFYELLKENMESTIDLLDVFNNIEGNFENYGKFKRLLFKQEFNIILDDVDYYIIDVVINDILSYNRYSSSLLVKKCSNNEINTISEIEEQIRRYINSNEFIEDLKNIIIDNNIDVDTLQKNYLKETTNLFLETFLYCIADFLKRYPYKITDFNSYKSLLKELNDITEYKIMKAITRQKIYLQSKPWEEIENGIDFENYIASLFSKLGYKVETTPKTGDQGADLILYDLETHEKTVVQCKFYKGSVGVEAVQQAIAAKKYYKADHAIVVTNSKYTKSAKELALRSNVELIDGQDLLFLLKKTQELNEKKI